MQRPLDPLGFRENRYERPNQDWVCGRTDEQHPCPLGPDARGNCRATGECLPAKRGDRWSCTRSEAAGGKCTEGPLPDGACAHPILPCQPTRSLRRSRALAVWLVVVLTGGLLLIFLGVAMRRPVIDAGTLTNAHATSASTCRDCHSLDQTNLGAALLSGSLGQRALRDSALCLKCHEEGAQPLNPHGLPPAALAHIRAEQSPSAKTSAPLALRVSRQFAAHGGDAGALACALCHQEHHGRNFNLAQMSNAQCQTCHAVQFASFGQGHPEFAGYPAQRRTRIFFDHQSHLREHFPATRSGAPQGCQDCHTPGPAGRFMQVKSFEKTCASCHAAQIRGEGMTTKGVAFFAVPGIDAETLAARGHSVGEWPRLADARLTPFMELLLSRQPAARAALEQLRGVDLLDLRTATPEQLAAAESYAWEVKRLLFHLVTEGQSYLLAQMAQEVSPIGLELPRATILAAQKEWMPNLLTEMAAYEKGVKPTLAPTPAPSLTSTPSLSAKTAPPAGDGDLLASDDLSAAAATPTPAPADDDLTGGDLLSASPVAEATPAPSATPAPAIPAEEWVAAGGWYRPQESFTLYYRPAGHADPFLVAWLEAAQRSTVDPHIFDRMADRQAPGLCLKCHTIDQTAPGQVQVNWTSAQPDGKSHPFTTFSHTKHFSLVGDAGCQTCHKLDPQSTYPKFFAEDEAGAPRRDPQKFQSNFAPMPKLLCAECHQPRVAGDNCTLCHRYHAAPDRAGELAEIGRFRPAQK